MPKETETITDNPVYAKLETLSREYFRFNPLEFPSAGSPDLHSALFSTNDVVSGFGLYIDKDGKNVVRIYMRRKRKSNLKDPIIADCRTERVYLGEDVLASTKKLPAPTQGPLSCGRSIGAVSDLSQRALTGTLGAKVRIGEAEYGLSNNHVFAGLNFFPKGKPFNMPSPGDLAPTLGSKIETVGHLHKAYPINYGLSDHVAINTMDAALIKIAPGINLSSWQGSHFDTPSKIESPKPGMKVKKVGRTTDLTFGIVKAVSPLRRLNTGSKEIPFFLCAQMWEIEPITTTNQLFSKGGDSGSLIVTEDESASVGLLVSGSPVGTTFMVALRPILDYFGAELVSG